MDTSCPAYQTGRKSDKAMGKQAIAHTLLARLKNAMIFVEDNFQYPSKLLMHLLLTPAIPCKYFFWGYICTHAKQFKMKVIY